VRRTIHQARQQDRQPTTRYAPLRASWKKRSGEGEIQRPAFFPRLAAPGTTAMARSTLTAQCGVSRQRSKDQRQQSANPNYLALERHAGKSPFSAWESDQGADVSRKQRETLVTEQCPYAPSPTGIESLRTVPQVGSRPRKREARIQTRCFPSSVAWMARLQARAGNEPLSFGCTGQNHPSDFASLEFGNYAEHLHQGSGSGLGYGNAEARRLNVL